MNLDTKLFRGKVTEQLLLHMLLGWRAMCALFPFFQKCTYPEGYIKPYNKSKASGMSHAGKEYVNVLYGGEGGEAVKVRHN